MSCCEQVLEILTEGKVSPREHQMLAEHLCDCTSCRRLAEALSPAVALFRDVLREDAEEAEFAAAWGTDDAELSLGEHSGERLLAGREHLAGPWDAEEASAAQNSRRRWTGRSWMGAMGLAAALLIGVMLGGVATSSTSRLTGGFAARGFGEPARPSSRAMLESLGLSNACWLPPEGTLLVSTSSLPHEEPARHSRPVELADLNCCTFCHAADKPLKPVVAKASTVKTKTLAANELNARLQTSCQLCHVSPAPVGPFTTARVQ